MKQAENKAVFMNKTFLTSMVLITAVLLFIPRAFAFGPATVYKVTVSNSKICKADGSCTTINQASSTIDIAAVDSGQVAGNFISGATLSDGTYTSVKVTPSADFVISGSDTNGGITYYTTGTLTNGECVVTTNSALQAPCTITAPQAPGEQTNTFSTPITIKNGVADHKIRVIFDVSQVIYYDSTNGGIYPYRPSVTFSED